MSLLIGKESRVLIQGITGNQGRKTTREMIDYGTPVAAGVTPGRSGDNVHGIPVYGSVTEALAAHPDINTSLVCVPRDGAKDAAFEAIGSGSIRLVNILTEGLARQDAARIVCFASQRQVRVVGPASVGIIAPGERVKLGAIGGNDPGIFYPGPIAIFSKSGGMSLSIATDVFNRLGHGTSLVVGIGGDRITGTSFVDLLEIVRNDPETRLVILMGEVGGTYEEEAAAYLARTDYPKPVIVRLTGIGAQRIFPRGARMGHAGAIIGDGSTGTYESKVAAFREAGVPVAETPDELIELVEQAMPRSRELDLESAVSDDLELVSISKPKLEGLKSEVRAVRVRTAMTRLVDGVPFFRGYELTELIREAGICGMLWMSLKKEDPDPEKIARLCGDFMEIARQSPAQAGAFAAAKTCLQGGGGFHSAVSAGLMAQAEPDLSRPPLAGMREHYRDEELKALSICVHTVSLIASLFGNNFAAEPDAPIESAILEALSGSKPSAAHSDLFRAIYVACVDHTPATPSSLAAMASYSGGGTLKTALAAGISAMGDVHAGAGEAAARIFMEFIPAFQAAARKGEPMTCDGGKRIHTLEDLADFIIDTYSGEYGGKKRKIPGYGHRYYSLYGRDPRAVAVLEAAAQIGIDSDYVRLALSLESRLKERKATGLCLNVDGAIGVLLCVLGLRPEAGKALFIIPRTAGILGQLLEQHEGSFFRLSNESVLYVGPEMGRKYGAKH